MSHFRQLQRRHDAFERHVEAQLAHLRERLTSADAFHTAPDKVHTAYTRDEGQARRGAAARQSVTAHQTTSTPLGNSTIDDEEDSTHYMHCSKHSPAHEPHEGIPTARHLACDEATRLSCEAMMRESAAEQRRTLHKRLCEMQERLSADVVYACKRWLQQHEQQQQHQQNRRMQTQRGHDGSEDEDEDEGHLQRRVTRVEAALNRATEHMGVLAMQVQRVLCELQKERADRLSWQRTVDDARAGQTDPTMRDSRAAHSTEATSSRSSLGAMVVVGREDSLTEQKVQQDIIQPALAHVRRLMSAHQKLLDTVVEQRCERAERVINDSQRMWEHNVTELRSKLCSLRHDVRNAFSELCQNLSVACPGM